MKQNLLKATIAISLSIATTSAYADNCNLYNHPMHIKQCQIDMASTPTGETGRSLMRGLFNLFGYKTPKQAAEYEERRIQQLIAEALKNGGR